MIDTLMVLWTRGICNRLLQTLATFLCLFTGICVLLFLVTASGVKWQGLAVSVTPGTAASTPVVTPTATPAPVYIGLPPILQNPTPHPRVHHMLQPTIESPVSAPTDTSNGMGSYPSDGSGSYQPNGSGGDQTLFP